MKILGPLLIRQTRRMYRDRIRAMGLRFFRFCCLCVAPPTLSWLNCLFAGVVVPWLGLVVQAQSGQDFGWRNYGNDPGGTRYSSARQIDRTNISRLQLAWTYRTGAMEQETELKRKAAFEATPILAYNKLFLSTPYNHVIALDPQTGARLWEYDAHVNLAQNRSEVTSRGVSAWQDLKRKAGQPCHLRIFLGTLDGRLVALDGETGKPCLDFGSKGEVDLTRGVALATEWTGGYEITSAPSIYNDFVIVGSSVADNWKVDTERGIVRAYDARTGKLRWSWNPSPVGRHYQTSYRRL